MRKLDAFMLTCAFVLVANVCYVYGKHDADRWWHENPMQSKCVQINSVTGGGEAVIWGDCKVECLQRVFTKDANGHVFAQCFCE